MATTPAARTYTGAWRDSTRYMDRALPPAPGVDPAHLYPDAPSEGSRPPPGAPSRLDYPPLYATEMPDAAYAHAVDTPGLILDTEEITHENEISRPVPSVGHQVDQGAQLRQTYQHPYMRAYDELYLTPRTEEQPIQGDLTVATLRGDNSLPENNPDGYRYGWRVKRWVHRRAFPTTHRQHMERWLRPAGAAAAVQSPDVVGTNRYTSPFSWNKQAIGTLLQNPVFRRSPEPWSEVSETDGVESSFEDYQTWTAD